jgi:hypothetical protein
VIEVAIVRGRVFPRSRGEVDKGFCSKSNEKRAMAPSWCRARGVIAEGQRAWCSCFALVRRSQAEEGSGHEGLMCRSPQPIRHHDGQRQRDCLHEKKSIWHSVGEVQQIYFMGMMHNRHTRSDENGGAV